jgi:hypothetical protein
MDRGQASFGVVKRLRDNDPELHSDKEVLWQGTFCLKISGLFFCLPHFIAVYFSVGFPSIVLMILNKHCSFVQFLYIFPWQSCSLCWNIYGCQFMVFSWHFMSCLGVLSLVLHLGIYCSDCIPRLL